MAAGAAAGLLARALPQGPELTLALQLIGDSFVQLLKLIVPPLVFSAVVTSIAGLRDFDGGPRLVARTFLWFALAALAAVTIGIALGLWLQPGNGAIVDARAAVPPRIVGGWFDFLKGLIPANWLGLTATTRQIAGAARQRSASAFSRSS